MEPTRPQLRVGQLEVIYTGLFRVPVIRLPTLDSGVHDQFFRRLERFEPSLQNSGFSASWHNLAESYFEIKLLGGYGQIRLWPHAVEIRVQGGAPSLITLPPDLLEDQVSQLLAETAAILRGADDGVAFASHAVTLNLHGRLTGTTVLEFLRGYVKEPPTGLGETVEVSARYTCGPADERLSSWLLMEPSASIRPNGVFMNLGAVFTGESVEARAVAGRASDYFRSLVRSGGSPVEVVYVPSESS